MTISDASLMKDRIINFLKIKGPSLPVHIAKAVGMDMLFTSAFLSELISNRMIKTSYMKVGTSPVYLLPEQDVGLERYIEYINGKEREALILLKNEKFLVDSEQEPAIKVAFRNLKDFAKAFEKDGKVIWRYFTENEGDYKKEEVPKSKPEEEAIEKSEGKEESAKKRKVKKMKGKVKKTAKKGDEKFFNKIKEHLAEENFEILDIMSFNKKDLVLKVKKGKEEKAVIAYDKRKITDKDILDAYKKAESMGLNYSIFSMGEAPKKTSFLITALKTLNSIEKVN
ncbi:MAG: hypothetical protein Q8Q04_01870 [archaeon]|nr:hypothetical protein [archaeon]